MTPSAAEATPACSLPRSIARCWRLGAITPRANRTNSSGASSTACDSLITSQTARTMPAATCITRPTRIRLPAAIPAGQSPAGQSTSRERDGRGGKHRGEHERGQPPHPHDHQGGAGNIRENRRIAQRVRHRDSDEQIVFQDRAKVAGLVPPSVRTRLAEAGPGDHPQRCATHHQDGVNRAPAGKRGQEGTECGREDGHHAHHHRDIRSLDPSGLAPEQVLNDGKRNHGAGARANALHQAHQHQHRAGDRQGAGQRRCRVQADRQQQHRAPPDTIRAGTGDQLAHGKAGHEQ